MPRKPELSEESFTPESLMRRLRARFDMRRDLNPCRFAITSRDCHVVGGHRETLLRGQQCSAVISAESVALAAVERAAIDSGYSVERKSYQGDPRRPRNNGHYHEHVSPYTALIFRSSRA